MGVKNGECYKINCFKVNMLWDILKQDYDLDLLFNWQVYFSLKTMNFVTIGVNINEFFYQARCILLFIWC